MAVECPAPYLPPLAAYPLPLTLPIHRSPLPFHRLPLPIHPPPPPLPSSVQGLNSADIAAVLSATADAFADLDALRLACGSDVGAAATRHQQTRALLTGAWRRFVVVIGSCALRIATRMQTGMSPSHIGRNASNPW